MQHRAVEDFSASGSCTSFCMARFSGRARSGVVASVNTLLSEVGTFERNFALASRRAGLRDAAR